uniref:Polynucleotide 5'-hydroxyl-kinase NOL9 n=1 Tax=Castor canadensis TaxID=51338 RepID=A0A8B7UD69_CASCN|nr:polynucleotide 5'-hydroxyl-kinase NOL9 isoform X2 [Castor canadensis]
MADSELRLRRVPCRFALSKARKTRPKLILSRRARRRLGTQRRGERRRLRRRRRLLQAQAAGADYREGTGQGSRAEAARKPKAAAPSPARSVRAAVPVPLVRQGFTFGGICRVTCLYGQVEVFGYTISQGQPAQDVYSAYTHAYLTLNAVPYSTAEKSEKEIRREVRALLKSHLNLEDRSWSIENFSPLCSIVMLEQLKTSTINFITSYPGLSYVFVQESPVFQINPEYLALRSVGIRKQKRKKGLALTESARSALEELVSVSCEEIDGCAVILVCGTQDIGKSTFNRYLINQLLNSISCVDYLECDLGQTEFTPPGCISLLNITEPVLGPPFTHQRTPQKMVYYGKPSCKNNYENYVEIIKYVFSSYRRESPLIINTMGWVSDEGLLLLIDLIRLLSPSHVIQLSSPQSKYMPNLTPEYVDDMDGLYTKSKSKSRNRCFVLPEFADSLEFADEEKDSPVPFTGHKLICVRSEFPVTKTPRNRESHNRILRDLAVLGYLGQLMPPVPKPLGPLHGLTPYQVPFSAVALRITHADVAPTHILYAVNASWIGLCKILDDVRGYTRGPILLAQTPICDCLGFGELRVNPVSKPATAHLFPLHMTGPDLVAVAQQDEIRTKAALFLFLPAPLSVSLDLALFSLCLFLRPSCLASPSYWWSPARGVFCPLIGLALRTSSFPQDWALILRAKSCLLHLSHPTHWQVW